jgi:hypothetical protein
MDANGDTNTLVFAFPVKSKGAKSAEHVSLWQQASNLVTLQREWADNSVSNTLYFRPKWVLKHSGSDREALEKFIQGQEWTPWKILDLVDQGGGELTNRWKVEVQGSLINLYEYNLQHEEDDIEPLLASILPAIKACSLLPHTPNGVYKQMPEEGITKEEYEKLRSAIQPIDWSTFSGSDGEDERFCQGDKCAVPGSV